MLTAMERILGYFVYEQEFAFIAQCLNVDVASEGDTETGALSALKEALELYFEGAKVPVDHAPALRFGVITINA
jgi:hypothetical protein